MSHCVKLILADTTKALVCSTNSHVNLYSYLYKLFGDPDQYAYKFGNATFTDQLPIHINRLYYKQYDSFHSVTIDYNTQRVYYGNNARERLELGLYIHNNSTRHFYVTAGPETNQVTKSRTLHDVPVAYQLDYQLVYCLCRCYITFLVR